MQAVRDRDSLSLGLAVLQVEADALRLQVAAHPNPELRAKLEEAGVDEVCMPCTGSSRCPLVCAVEVSAYRGDSGKVKPRCWFGVSGIA